MTVSPDGKDVYVASTISNAIVRFKRDKRTGAITEPAGSKGCVSDDGSGGCADGHALLDAVWIGSDPDGKTLYVASLMSNAVTILKRHANGAISEPAGAAGCVSDDGSGPCADGHALSGPFALAISPNGKSVYAATNASNAVVRFKRDRSSGTLTQPAGSAGCVSEDGSGPCADGHALTGADSVLVSPDGENVYVASGNAVATFKRNETTGAIAEATGTNSCISDDGSGPCLDGRGLAGIFAAASSRDGKSIYVASLDSDAVARLDRGR